LPASNTFANASASFSVPSDTANITIFHIISAVGSLTIDNAALQQHDKTGIFTTGAISFTFDDGWLSQKTYVIPKMASAGIKGTFFVTTRQTADYGYTGYMGSADFKNLYNNGHEIGSHTRTHAHLSSLSSSQQSTEIFGSRDDLLAMNVGPVSSFAYPFGEYNQTTLGLLRGSAYRSARATINGNVVEGTDPYQLPRYSAEITSTFNQFKQQIDAAIAQKSWLILTFHRVDSSGTRYSIPPTLFNQVVDYVKQKNVPVVTVAQGMEDMP
jgi:peptidoglycan/xylan/chitin deacetylase (PgdA/CDA1 family)